ncbi:hypothetical protein [Denitrobaculum tricleocarpae]|uniref:Cytochrome P460 domain-containing protein n=1 Tax=Denitrobaculum tricleocarpae TaxID=2591009 RepID=A0A545TMM2_9PROT|nr:hypothetical protein [Denitrobaculum tricleocarpae]TQV78480.1 hypothetical protein FKG95_18130 [Denitrobaculum tricleocarpae]
MLLGSCSPKEHPVEGFPPDFSLSSCLADTQSCAKVCVAAAKDCAAAFNRDLHEVDFESNPNWHRFPIVNVGGPRFNSSTPMHGNLVEVFLNRPAFDKVNLILDDTKARKTSLLDQVDLPNGSIIFKRNYVTGPDPKAANWPTVMIKLDGYCKADEFRIGGQCPGGNWFWFLYRGALFDFDGMAAYGKPQDFCLGCHAPTQRSDYSFLLDSLRLKFGSKTFTRNMPELNAPAPDFCDTADLSPDLPGDVGANPAKLTPDQAQTMFDCLSWRSFIALNWPVALDGDRILRGEPDRSSIIGQAADRPSVWESYREVYETFQPQNPHWTLDNRNFDDPQEPPLACGKGNGYRKVFRMNSKFRSVTQVLNETHQAFGNQFNTLVDQKKQTLRYEVRFNRAEFEYLKANELANTGNYSASGPFDRSALPERSKYFDVRFPAGTHNTAAKTPQEGAIEIKGAWRVLCTPDPGKKGGLDCAAPANVSDLDHLENLKKRYVTREGDYFEATSEGDICTQGYVFGLVGLHVAHKTFWAPQWVWSTFEHVDNVPPADSAGDAKTDYTLFSRQAAENTPGPAACMTQRPGVFPPSEAKLPVACRERLAAEGIQTIENGRYCANLQLILNNRVHPACAPTNPTPKPPVANQVTRLNKIGLGGDAVRLNEKFRAQLKGTAFENYVLVNTQWPIRANVPGNPKEVYTRPCGLDNQVASDCFRIAPIDPANNTSVRLRNTTMETFQVSYNPLDGNNDRSVQKSSVGCMQCHNKTGIDASYVWVDAEEEVVPIAQPSP